DSEFSKAALMESSCWLKRHGGKAVLVHSVFSDEEEFADSQNQRSKRFEQGKNICYFVRDHASAEFGLNGNLESMVCEGEPHDVLINVATSRNADLIAIGTHGRKGLKKLFLGSVTGRVLVSSPCDVLVVKKKLGRCTGNFESVLLSFDGSEYGRKALDRACELAQLEGSRVTAFYVIPRYEEMIEFLATSLIRENLQHDAEKIMESARAIAKGHGVDINTEVASGDEAEEIVAAAKRLNSDLVIRATHAWSGVDRAIIGSISEKVFINAPCPVLVIK
ncbi:MAG TPA: universal stress protein, partial [Thermodesulfovibrionales bacterium]|nr:universal stress protein [Thermodesulfovibrionales bacterium]